VNILSLVLDRTGFLFIKGTTAFKYALRYFVGSIPHAREYSNILKEKSKISQSKLSFRDTRNGFSTKVLLPSVEPSPTPVAKRSFSFDSTVMFNDAPSDAQYTQQAALSSIDEGAEVLYPQACDFLMLDDDVSYFGSDEEESFDEISKSLVDVLQETESEQQKRIVSRLPFPKSLKKSAVYNASCFKLGKLISYWFWLHNVISLSKPNDQLLSNL
jgi:hypothetical protein